KAYPQICRTTACSSVVEVLAAMRSNSGLPVNPPMRARKGEKIANLQQDGAQSLLRPYPPGNHLLQHQSYRQITPGRSFPERLLLCVAFAQRCPRENEDRPFACRPACSDGQLSCVGQRPGVRFQRQVMTPEDRGV